jgi:hypothetical protein
LKVNLKLTLVNIGNKPIFFFNKEYYPNFCGMALFQNIEEADKGKSLALDYFGESVNTSAIWSSLRKELDKPKPTENAIYFLQPNKEWVVDIQSSLSLPTEKYKYSDFPNRESWENIQKLGKVWVKILGPTWSLNLETDKNNSSELNFGKKLQKRWSKYGHLWLDDVVSEPIPLDLSSVVVKTENR